MNLLNQKCKIERAVVSKNSQMQTVKTWITVADNVPCNIQFNAITDNRYNQTVSGQIVKSRFAGFFESSQDIIKGDRITWSDMILYVDGPTLPVYGGSNEMHHKEIMFAPEET